MFRLPDGSLRFSPGDLVAYLEGDFAAWCERMLAERAAEGGARSAEVEWATPDKDPEGALAAQKGLEHEERYLARCRETHPDLTELVVRQEDGVAVTLAAMQSGAPAIYQAHLSAGDWHGYPDFLFRCTTTPCACGDHHYTPWDTKLARSAKPNFLVQLCAYAELLETVRGYRPTELVFVLGQGDEQRFPTRQFFYYYRQLNAALPRSRRLGTVPAFPNPASTGAGDAGRAPPKRCSPARTT